MTKPQALTDDYEWLKEDIAGCENDWSEQCPSRWIGIAKDLLSTIDELKKEIKVHNCVSRLH